MSTTPVHCARIAAVMAIALAGAAASATPRADSLEAVYRQDVANCHAGRTYEALPICLREAERALMEGRRGGLETDLAALDRNAMARCAYVHEEDRDICRRMVQGEGEREGSVAEGAIVKEIVTIEPAAPASEVPQQ